MSANESQKPKGKFTRVAPLKVRYGGVSDMWITRKMRDDGFPAPVYLGGGRDRYWITEQLDQWDNEQLTREAPKTKTAPPSRRKAVTS